MTCIHGVGGFSKHRDLEFCFFFSVTHETLGYPFAGPFSDVYFPGRFYCEISREEIISLFYKLQVHKQKKFKHYSLDWKEAVDFYNSIALEENKPQLVIPTTVQFILEKYSYAESTV